MKLFLFGICLTFLSMSVFSLFSDEFNLATNSEKDYFCEAIKGGHICQEVLQPQFKMQGMSEQYECSHFDMLYGDC